MTSREKIEAMLADDPGDTFLRYSLAMELDKEGNHDASLATIRRTDARRSAVCARLLHGRPATRAAGAIDEARTILRDGIAAARIQDDLHAAGEMTEFLASLGAAD